MAKHAAPDPGPEPERTSAQVVHSPFDVKITLHIDAVEYEGWIEWHVDSPEFACKLMLDLALRRGWEPIEDCENEDLGGGWWRMYLVTIEVIPDDPRWVDCMPPWEMEAHGPMSGFMEAV